MEYKGETGISAMSFHCALPLQGCIQSGSNIYFTAWTALKPRY